MDRETLTRVRDHLLQAAELLTAGINADAGVKETCRHPHEYQIDLTTMSSQKRQLLCNRCGVSWEEDLVEEEISSTFGGLPGRIFPGGES